MRLVYKNWLIVDIYKKNKLLFATTSLLLASVWYQMYTCLSSRRARQFRCCTPINMCVHVCSVYRFLIFKRNNMRDNFELMSKKEMSLFCCVQEDIHKSCIIRKKKRLLITHQAYDLRLLVVADGPLRYSRYASSSNYFRLSLQLYVHNSYSIFGAPILYFSDHSRNV